MWAERCGIHSQDTELSWKITKNLNWHSWTSQRESTLPYHPSIARQLRDWLHSTDSIFSTTLKHRVRKRNACQHLKPNDLHVSMSTRHHRAGANTHLALREPHERHHKDMLMVLHVYKCEDLAACAASLRSLQGSYSSHACACIINIHLTVQERWQLKSPSTLTPGVMQRCSNIFRHTLQERNKNKKTKLHSGAAGDGCLFDEACECGN